MTILQNTQTKASLASPSTLRLASARRRRAVRDTLEYKALYALTYPFFLFAAAAGRMTGASRAQEGRSVFGEANELASATIPMAFMG